MKDKQRTPKENKPSRRRCEAWKKAIHMELREHKSSFLVFTVLRMLVVVTMVLQFFNKNYENVYLCVLTLLLLIVPSFLQVSIKVELPTGLEISILLFIFSASIL